MGSHGGYRNACLMFGWSFGAAVTVCMSMAPSAHADSTVDVNGWTVDTDGSAVSPATLLDPGDSLGNGTQIAGSLDTYPYTLDQAESIDLFNSTSLTAPFADIRDEWLTPTLLESTVAANSGTTGGVTEGFFATTLSGAHIVDLLNLQPDTNSLASAVDPTVPMINPDAVGAVDVGGVAVAGAQDGALFNDIVDALMTGNAGDWANAGTLATDLLTQ